MTAVEFFRLVDEFLTPAMTRLGYHRIGATAKDQPISRGILHSPSPSSARRVAKSSSFLVYDFGFEAGSEEVKRFLHPGDPETVDELWLSYDPATGELDLRAWVNIAQGRVDCARWADTGPCSEAELRRRLAALGSAVESIAEPEN